MKYVFRNSFIHIISFLGVVFLYRMWVARKGPLVRVVGFHDVENADWFARVIETLVTECNVISPKQFHSGDLKRGVVNVLITFDDGYASWIHTCLPVLSKHGIYGIFFINSGPLDGVSHDAYIQNNLKLSPKQLLTWSGAHTLLHEGHTIGGHTSHHLSLTHLALEASSVEVGDDKRRIEQELQATLTDFAYPFGTAKDFSRDTEMLIRKEGYEYVYTAESGFVSNVSHHIPRTLFEKNQSIKSITLWLKGGYDMFAWIKRILQIFR